MPADLIESFPPLSDGRAVRAMTLRCGPASCRLIDYGARVQSLIVPDASGRPTDVALGFEDMAGYEADGISFGCTTGPVAGRIDHGRFSLDGVDYQLPTNDPDGNHLHGADLGLWVQTWDIAEVSASAVTFTWEQQPPAPGQIDRYPGRVRYRVTYELREAPRASGEKGATQAAGYDLVITYHAATDTPTPINLTNHTYFNLGGATDEGGRAGDDLYRDLLDTVVRIDGSNTLAVTDRLVPTGELAAVDGTPLDFREPHAIGERIGELQNKPRPGYDHVWVLDSPAQVGQLREVGTASHAGAGLTLSCLSDQPCLVFYVGNFLDGSLRGKGGVTYGYRTGFCFEAQRHTDAINHHDPDAGRTTFPDIVVRPSRDYHQTCVYRLTVG